MPRLLDSVREAARALRHSLRTQEAYVRWIREHILFFGKRHLSQLRPRETSAFASHLAVARNVSASTQNQALSALLFLYREALAQPSPLSGWTTWSGRSGRSGRGSPKAPPRGGFKAAQGLSTRKG